MWSHTLGKTKSDKNSQMIKITSDFYLVTFSKWDVSNVITLSGW